MKKDSLLIYIFFFLMSLLALNSSYAQWQKFIIDTDINEACSMELADFNGDSITDYLVTNWRGNELVWYQNNYPSWDKHLIKYVSATFALPADIDGNDTTDVVACLWSQRKMVWYENRYPEWIKHTIDDNTDDADFTLVGDLNNDGKPDVVTAGDYQNGGDIVWYENNYPDWIEHIIASSTDQYPTIELSDIDNDGFLDVSVVVLNKNKVLWYKNEGNGLAWTEYTVDDNAISPFIISSFDINEDGFPDVIASSREKGWLFWYENQHPVWIKHMIEDNLVGADWTVPTDIDGDDDLDMIVISAFGNMLIWYENKPEGWEKHTIDDDLYYPRLFELNDIDNDQVIDIIVTAGDCVAWYKNPFTTTAYPISLATSPGYVPANRDTAIHITAQIHNPENHETRVRVFLNGMNSAFCDSLELFDDGMHGDGGNCDSIFGNRIELSIPGEDVIQPQVYVFDSLKGIRQYLPSPTGFASVGPIVLDSSYFVGSDTLIYQGDRPKIYLVLRNNGTITTAEEISVKVISLDPYIEISDPEQVLMDIPAGETRQISTYFIIDVADDCPEGYYDFSIEISSHGKHYWNDTLSLYVLKIETLEYLNNSGIRIYPNPAGDQVFLEFGNEPGEEATIEICDLRGLVIQREILRNSCSYTHTVNLAPVREGIYFIRINTDNNTYIQKVIKVE